MNRRCMNCMQEFAIPPGYENDNNVCPFCGFVENTRPKILYHLFPGTVLANRYIVGTVLGAGGFGVTYKCWDSVLNVVVAIKEHYPAYFVQRVPGARDVIVYDGNKRKEYMDSLERFLEEARNTALFQNPNIVHVDNFFEENGTAYIVMEFLEGISLKEYLKQNGGKLSPENLDHITLPVISGLRAIHEKGFIHRDVSPDNIFLTNGGGVKLIDFGAARFSDGEKERTRSIILKPGYAPPEQYQTKSLQGPWTDIYALAATIYRAVTGVVPTESVNRFSEEFVKKKDLLQEPKELDPAIPDYLNNTIMKGMAIEPGLRFQNVDEFEAAYLHKKRVTNPYKDRRRRLRRRAILAAVIALMIAVGALYARDRYHRMRRAVVLEDAAITVWISYPEEMSRQEAVKYGESITKDFTEEYDNIHVDIRAIPEEAYMESLEEAAEDGTLPDLFMSDGASEKVLAETIPVKDVFDYLELGDLSYVEDYRAEIEKAHQFPTGCYFPVVYVRRTNNLDLDTVEVGSLADVEKNNGMAADNGSLELSAGTLSLKTDELKAMDREEALPLFAEGEITYYLATTEEYQAVTDAAAGLFEMRPYTTDRICGEFSDYWSISSHSSERQRIAAEVALSYLMMDKAQEQIHISYPHSLPLNKEAYGAYVEINGKFDILEGYQGKTDLSLSFDEE